MYPRKGKVYKSFLAPAYKCSVVSEDSPGRVTTIQVSYIKPASCRLYPADTIFANTQIVSMN
jgi:hypothetical protein